MLETEEYKKKNNAEKIYDIQLKVRQWKQDIKNLVKDQASRKKQNGDFTEEESVKKYGFNPLKKAEVERKYGGRKGFILDKAKEAYHKQFGKPKDKISYDWNKLDAFAEHFSNKFKLGD